MQSLSQMIYVIVQCNKRTDPEIELIKAEN